MPDPKAQTSDGLAGGGPRALYPNAYAWFVLLSSLDVLLTYLILHPLFSSPQVYGAGAGAVNTPEQSIRYIEGGQEVNALADWVIREHDVPGMVIYKFSLVALIIVVCEVVGRRRGGTGRRLAEWSVAITSIPVVVALIQLGADVHHWLRGS